MGLSGHHEIHGTYSANSSPEHHHFLLGAWNLSLRPLLHKIWSVNKLKQLIKIVPIVIVLVACGLFWASFGVSEDLHSQLTKAAASGKTSQVMSILDKGIPPDAHDSEGKTAFGLAALNGQIGTLALLATRGADVNVRDKYRRTPLMAASFRGHFEVVVFLLEKRADVNAKDQYGQTPLIYAAANGRQDIVKLLLSMGADVNARTRQGFTALSLATDQGHHSVADLILENKPEQSGWPIHNDYLTDLFRRHVK